MSYLRPAGRDLERFDGLSLIYWTLMGPYGMDRTVHCIEFYDCTNGLGIKVIGGIKELTGEEYGVYVKRILPGGVAYADGRLQPGDQILEVNGDSLLGVTSERAVDILRTASATNHMRLLIARDDDARREFTELLEKFGSHSNTGSARGSPVLLSGGRYLDSTSSGSSSRSQSPLLLSPANSHGPLIGNPGHSPHSISQCPFESGVQSITIAKSSGLGLTIGGGANRPDGPMVYVQELHPEGDCYRDGRLRVEDQLIAINKDSLVGATHEEAKRLLAKTKFRHEGSSEVAFIPGRCRLHPGLSAQNNIHALPPKSMGNGLSSCRLKVHVRSPESRHDSPFPVPSPSPDICPPELTVSAPASPSSQRAAPGTKPKVTLDPNVRLKDGKLELILQYLSLEVSEEKKRQLRQSLTTDSQGTVAYGDVLQALRDVLPEELEDAGLDANSVLFTQHEVATLLDPSAFHSLACDSISYNDSEELEQLQLETAELRQEVRRLKSLLKDMESSKKSMEEELQRLNQKALGFLSENRSLHNKLQVAEASQWQAHSAERDYEGVIHLLEAEIVELKTQLLGKKVRQASEAENDFLELKRQLSLTDGQLRKSDVARKRLEMFNRKLLLFVQNAHRHLSTSPEEKRVESQVEAEKPRGISEASLPSSELVHLLTTEANELLEHMSLFNTTQNALPHDLNNCSTGDGTHDHKEPLYQKTTWPPPPNQSNDNNLQSPNASSDLSEKPS